MYYIVSGRQKQKRRILACVLNPAYNMSTEKRSARSATQNNQNMMNLISLNYIQNKQSLCTQTNRRMQNCLNNKCMKH